MFTSGLATSSSELSNARKSFIRSSILFSCIFRVVISPSSCSGLGFGWLYRSKPASIPFLCSVFVLTLFMLLMVDDSLLLLMLVRVWCFSCSVLSMVDGLWFMLFYFDADNNVAGTVMSRTFGKGQR